MGKINRDLIAFKKNLVVIENLSTKAIKIPSEKEELIVHFNERPHVVSLQNELMNLGYMISLDVLYCMTDEEAKRIASNVLPYAKELLGADGNWAPLYGGFPAQVEDMTEYELFVDQILHYLSVGSWSPSIPEKYKALKSAEAYENPSLVKIKGTSPKDFIKIFYSIIGSVNSITEFDREVVVWFLENMESSIDFNSLEIPFKETLCIFLTKYHKIVEASSVTITDILRTIVQSQGGDITLPPMPAKMINNGTYWKKNMVPNPERENMKFKKMSRAERRYWLELIESKVSSKGLKNTVMDGKKYVGRWIRLGEILHPGQYKNRYPKAAEFFDALRNHTSDYKTWNAEVMALYKAVGKDKINCDMKNIILKVAERPGEFIRRFDSLYRRSSKTSKELLIKTMMNLQGASSKTLIEFFTHLDKRTERTPRFVSLPGSRKQTALPVLDPLTADEVASIKGAVIKALINTLSTKESWEGKKVVIDENLKTMVFPTDMRTISEGKLTVARGTKIPFDTQDPNNAKRNTVRFYTHWKDPKGCIDLDLHAFFINKDFSICENIGWNTSLCKNYAVHSGDVRQRVGDSAEYIDIKVKECLANGWRYVLLNLNSFSGQSFDSIESYFGWTYRSKPKQDLTWKPDQVVQNYKLSSSAKNIVCALIDLEEHWVKVIDYNYSGLPVASVRGNMNVAYCKFYAKDPELSTYLILNLNAVARKASEIMTLSDYEIWKDSELNHIHEMNKVRAEAGEELLPETIDESNVIIFTLEDFTADYTKLLSLI